jgi:hypothetical protein
MLAINTSVSQSTKKTPYELVFGQLPRHQQEFWQIIYNQTRTQSTSLDPIIDEEDILLVFDEQENPLDSSVCKL